MGQLSLYFVWSNKWAAPMTAGACLCVYGDKIFTDYTGSLATNGGFDGLNQITSGTGKFSGITGKAPFQCKALSAQGHFGCSQQFEYRLP